MNPIEHALKKVKVVLHTANFFYSLINALIVALLVSVFLRFFSVPVLYALIPGVILFVFVYRNKNKNVGFGDVEKRIPELEWRLRTSADNKERTDTIASSLHHDVMQRLNLVKISKFLSSKSMLYRFSLVLGLGILLAFVQAQDITFKNTQSALSDNPWINSLEQQKADLNKFSEDPEEAPDDIYGEKIVPNYGDKEEILELNQMNGLVDITTPSSTEEGKTFTQQSTGTSGQAVGAGNSQEKINERDKTVVENYFKKINQNS